MLQAGRPSPPPEVEETDGAGAPPADGGAEETGAEAGVGAAEASGAQKNFKLNFPNAKVASFAGFVKGTPVSGGINDVLAGSAEIRISGAVTVA